MTEENKQMLCDMEQAAHKIYSRVQPLIHNDTKMSAHDLMCITKTVAFCSSIMKNVAKTKHLSQGVEESSTIL